MKSYSPDFTISLILIFCVGFFILPILPVGYSFIVEVTHPVSEIMSTGVMMCLGQIAAILLTVAASFMGRFG